MGVGEFHDKERDNQHKENAGGLLELGLVIAFLMRILVDEFLVGGDVLALHVAGLLLHLADVLLVGSGLGQAGHNLKYRR